jgi:hypothetical protein
MPLHSAAVGTAAAVVADVVGTEMRTEGSPQLQRLTAAKILSCLNYF